MGRESTDQTRDNSSRSTAHRKTKNSRGTASRQAPEFALEEEADVGVQGGLSSGSQGDDDNPKQQAISQGGIAAYVHTKSKLYTKTARQGKSSKFSKQKGQKLDKNSAIVIQPEDEEHNYYKVTLLDNAIPSTDLYIQKNNIIVVGANPDQAKLAREDSPSTFDTVKEGADDIKDVYDNFIGNDGISGAVDYLSKTRWQEGDTVRGLEEGDQHFSQSNSDTATNLAFVGDGAAAGFGLVNLIIALKSNGDDAWESYENFLDGFYGAAKVSEGVAKVIGAATDNDTAADTGVFSEMVTHEIGAFKHAFLLIKEAVQLFKLHNEMSPEEQAQAGLTIVKEAFGIAHEAMYMVKNISELINGGSVASSVMASLPGLNIVINGLDLIQQVFYLAVSIRNKNSVSKERKEIARQASDNTELYRKDLVVDAHGSRAKHGKSVLNPLYHQQDTLESKIANIRHVIALEEAELGGERLSARQIQIYQSTVENIKTYGGPLSRISSVYREAKTNLNKNERLVLIKRELASAEEELSDFNDRVGHTPHSEYFDMYGLTKELENVNQKRINRSILHITADVAQIAGDIMNLTGVGAMAGGITKASGAALEAGAFILRSAKQGVHDKGSRQKVKGKDTFFSRNANDTKSMAAKNARRYKHSIMILKLLKDIEFGEEEEQIQAAENKIQKVDLLVTAAGGTMKKLGTFTEPSKMVKYLADCMAEREF